MADRPISIADVLVLPLRLTPGASRTEIDTAYRCLVRQHLLDASDDHEQFMRVKDACGTAVLRMRWSRR